MQAASGAAAKAEEKKLGVGGQPVVVVLEHAEGESHEELFTLRSTHIFYDQQVDGLDARVVSDTSISARVDSAELCRIASKFKLVDEDRPVTYVAVRSSDVKGSSMRFKLKSLVKLVASALTGVRDTENLKKLDTDGKIMEMRAALEALSPWVLSVQRRPRPLDAVRGRLTEGDWHMLEERSMERRKRRRTLLEVAKEAAALAKVTAAQYGGSSAPRTSSRLQTPTYLEAAAKKAAAAAEAAAAALGEEEDESELDEDDEGDIGGTLKKKSKRQPEEPLVNKTPAENLNMLRWSLLSKVVRCILLRVGHRAARAPALSLSA